MTAQIDAPPSPSNSPTALPLVEVGTFAQQVEDTSPRKVRITALVVTQPGSVHLAHTLAAVKAQSERADEVLVVDATACGARTFGQAVDAALRTREVEANDAWLWLLHDDSAPAPGALAALLRAVEHTTAIGIAGCKQRRWEYGPSGAPIPPELADGPLIEVGHTVTPLARRLTGIDDTEIDQGQHDGREDVLAVGLAGALVKTSLWRHLRGTDPAYGRFGDSTDFCRRARRAGHRVVVVPDAVIHHAQQSLLGARSTSGARRRSQLHHRLVHVPLLLLPFALLAMVLWAPVAAGWQLANKHPVAARSELSAALWNLGQARALWRARRNAARTATLPRRLVRPLIATWREVWAERRDARLARREAQRLRATPSDLELAELRELATRRRRGLVLVLVTSLAIATALFGPWLGSLASGARVVGGGLLPAPGGFAEVWNAATSGWNAGGLGAAVPADPVLMPLTALAALTGSAQTAVHLVLLGAIPLSALAGWFASGALTRRAWARAVAALVWATSPVLLSALSTGRYATVIALITAPFAILATIRAVGAQARDQVPTGTDAPPLSSDKISLAEVGGERRASLGAMAAAGLLAAVTLSAAPALLPAALVALLVAVLVARRARGSLPLVLLPTLVVGAPFWWFLTQTWLHQGPSAALKILSADPGVLAGTVAPEATPAAWQLLLGHPQVPPPWFENTGWSAFDGAGLTMLATLAPWVLGGALVLAALAGLLRPGRTTATRLAWLVAVLGLASATLTNHFGQWPGAVVALATLGLLGAGLCSVAPAQVRPSPPTGFGRVWRATAISLLVALPVAGVASWAIANVRPTASVPLVGELGVSGNVVPAVGRALQDGERSATVLQLDAGSPLPGGPLAPVEPLVTYTLLHSDGTALTDTSAVRQTPEFANPPAEATLNALVADLYLGQGAHLATRLGAFGIGAVQLPSHASADLVATLDLVPDLVRVTDGDGPLLWRVEPSAAAAPAWAQLRARDGSVLDTLPARHWRVDSQLAPRESGPEPHTLVLATQAHPRWRATLNGQQLAPGDPMETDGLQAFELPAEESGRLEVQFAHPHRPIWLAATAVVLVIFGLLALPGPRRKGRPAWH